MGMRACGEWAISKGVRLRLAVTGAVTVLLWSGAVAVTEIGFVAVVEVVVVVVVVALSSSWCVAWWWWRACLRG